MRPEKHKHYDKTSERCGMRRYEENRETGSLSLHRSGKRLLCLRLKFYLAETGLLLYNCVTRLAEVED